MNWLEFLNGFKDVVIVVFLGMGLKLMKQQNELLERDKSLKESEIDLQKAKIEHLELRHAPAIGRELDQASRTAEKLAEEKQKVEAKLKAVEEKVKVLEAEAAEGAPVATVEEVKDIATRAYVLGKAQASLEAVGFTREEVEAAHRRQTGGDPLSWPAQQARIESYLTRQAEEALEGKRPEEFTLLWKINLPTKDELTKICPEDLGPDP